MGEGVGAGCGRDALAAASRSVNVNDAVCSHDAGRTACAHNDSLATGRAAIYIYGKRFVLELLLGFGVVEGLHVPTHHLESHVKRAGWLKLAAAAALAHGPRSEWVVISRFSVGRIREERSGDIFVCIWLMAFFFCFHVRPSLLASTLYEKLSPSPLGWFDIRIDWLDHKFFKHTPVKQVKEIGSNEY